METMLLMGALAACAFILFKENISAGRGAAESAPVAKKAATKSAAKPKEAKPKAAKQAKPAAAKAAASASNKVKNPKTGETVSIPGNYRFAKRWIKEAMVSESVLDRIYKNNELDNATTIKVNKAMDQFKSIKKYQA